jgi:NAD(P)-dependent dehydrogenase (short-subunit alcohol dehydrogenase family)
VSLVAITGSASGIGLAARKRLERQGSRVIGVDLRDAEVIADLGEPAGRAAMVEEVTRLSGGALDGLVAGAGVAGSNGELIVSVNYFGAVATLAGLRPLLARGRSPSAVAISSNSVSTMPGLPLEVVERCLQGDEPGARKAASGGIAAYPASKLALARWVRRQAVTQDWVGAGIRLNAIAPGMIATPMVAGQEQAILALGDVYPVPARRAGTPEEIASLLAYLLSPDAGFFVGSLVFVDGGTDAKLRAEDWPTPRTR